MRRQSLKVSMLIWIGGGTLVGFFLLNAFFYYESIKEIKSEEETISDLVKTYVGKEQQSVYNTLDIALEAIVQNRNVQELFAKRDREKLAAYLLPTFNSIKGKGVAQFHFHIPPSISFLRLHKLDTFGDDLAAQRPLVSEAILTRKMITGLEEGKGGIGMREIKPMSLNGEFIGTGGGSRFCGWKVIHRHPWQW